MGQNGVLNHYRASLDRISVVDTYEPIRNGVYKACAGAEEMLRRLLPDAAVRIVKKRRPAKSIRREELTEAEVEEMICTVSSTCSYRYALATFADLFDYQASRFGMENREFLGRQIEQRTSCHTWPLQVLRDRAKIETILTSCDDLDREFPLWARGFCVPLLRVDHFFFAATAKGRGILERRYKVALRSLNDLLALVEATIRQAAQKGFAGVKTRLAAFRTLYIENVSMAHARAVFDKGGHEVTMDETKTFQDFLFHAVVQCATMHNMPIQIDSGFAGSAACSYDRANPLQLTDMIFNYGDARFAIVHGGFPFTGETAVLAKTFPNIYLDGSWIRRAASPTAKAVLHEWLEVVPCSKIMIWGGNSLCPEASYASLLMTKDIVAEVLAEKVEAGYLTDGLAVDIAWKLFRENARSFYALDARRETYAKTVGAASLVRRAAS